MPPELDARANSRGVLHIKQTKGAVGQRLVLALIGSGSDYSPDPGWKTLAGWLNSALILLWLGPSPDRTSLVSPGYGWSIGSRYLVWSGIPSPALAQPLLQLGLTALPDFGPG